MEWYIILALAIGIFVILFPIAYVWYLNMGAVYKVIRKAHEKQADREETGESVGADGMAASTGAREVKVFRKANEMGITHSIGRKDVDKTDISHLG
jgi:hypothetical protein